MSSPGGLSNRIRAGETTGNPALVSRYPGSRSSRTGSDHGDSAPGGMARREVGRDGLSPARTGPSSRSAPGRPSTETFAAGEIIFTPTQGDGLIHIIRAGYVRLYKTLPDGRSINVGLLGPNTVFAQEDTSDGIATGTTAEALVPSSVSILAVDDLSALIVKSPELASAVVAGMTRRLTNLQTLVEHLLVRDTSVRLSVTLLDLAATFGRPVTGQPGMIEITLPLTHQALANMIGSNRVTVTRKLLEFQRAGVARSLGRNALAVDLDRLQELAAGDPSRDGEAQATKSVDDAAGG